MKLNVFQLLDVLGALPQRVWDGEVLTSKTTGLSDQYDILSEVAGVLGLKKGQTHNAGGLDFKSLPSGKPAVAFARAYMEVLVDRFEKILTFPLRDQMIIYLTASTWPPNKFIKYAKYCTAAPMARFLQNELPEKPEGFEGHFFFSGKIKRLLKTRALDRNISYAGLFFGILNGVKRACDIVPDSFIIEAMEKHRKVLSQPPRGDPPDQVRCWAHPVTMEEMYERLFDKFRPKPPQFREASTHASYESSRSAGGSHGFLTSDTDLFQDDLLQMKEVRPGTVRELRGPALVTNWEQAVSNALHSHTEPLETSEEDQGFVRSAVSVEAITEPLKVRLITKGNAKRYWLAQHYQKQLSRYLSGTFPQFALTKRPFEALDLHNLLERERLCGVDQYMTKWVSGDYAGATDTIDLRHTKSAFEASLSKTGGAYSENYRNVLRSVLYEQDIHYPKRMVKKAKDEYGIDLSPVVQKTGQLMGSVLSFPILCTINLCAYWMTMEEFFDKKFELEELPVLVNGDDICFRCNDALYDLWLKNIKSVGFGLSLGKNYVSPDYVTINSMLFHFNANTGNIKEVKALNVGLLVGDHWATSRNPKPMSEYFTDLIEGSFNPVRTKKRFVHHNLETIKNVTKDGKYNLFVKKSKGGLGLVMPRELHERAGIKANPFQRRLGSYYDAKIYNDPSKAAFLTLRPLEKRALEDRGVIVDSTVQKPLKRIYNPTLIVQPTFGPYEEGIDRVTDPSFEVPVMGIRSQIDRTADEKALGVRHLSRAQIEEFRAGSWPEQNNALFGPESLRILEYRGTREVNPHTGNALGVDLTTSGTTNQKSSTATKVRSDVRISYRSREDDLDSLISIANEYPNSSICHLRGYETLSPAFMDGEACWRLLPEEFDFEGNYQGLLDSIYNLHESFGKTGRKPPWKIFREVVDLGYAEQHGHLPSESHRARLEEDLQKDYSMWKRGRDPGKSKKTTKSRPRKGTQKKN